LVEGTYKSLGDKHTVTDKTLTYSMNEEGSVVFTPTILPLGVTDDPANYIVLKDLPIQVDYERADIVSQIQDFLDNSTDRVTSANMLCRHFLPTYFSYDATYVGGSAPSIIAKDIIKYVDTLPIETEIDVSVLESLISNRGGNPDTPTKAIVTLHDWSRKVWVEFSENAIGGTTTLVPYDGTPRVSYFIPGPDVSGQSTPTPGERIKLTQR
jgi:hypothetical protein